MTVDTRHSGLGGNLRVWRDRRRVSQLELAIRAGTTQRHLSFIETGRSRPSAEMVAHLAEQLDVPLRERNQLLLAAGYAPRYGELALKDPGMAPVREAIDLILGGHEPYPALIVDRHWELIAANRGLAIFTEGVAPELLEPPANCMRIALHPDGLAPRIANLGEWRAHLLERLTRQLTLTGDAAIATLLDELTGYPGGDDEYDSAAAADPNTLVVPLRLRAPDGAELRFFSTVATFGTAVDITLAELSIESFFPADAETAAAISKLLPRA